MENFIVGKFKPNSLSGLKSIFWDNYGINLMYDEGANEYAKQKKLISKNNIDYLLGWSTGSAFPLLYVYRVEFKFDKQRQIEKPIYVELKTFSQQEKAIKWLQFKDRVIKSHSDCKDFLKEVQRRYTGGHSSVAEKEKGFKFADSKLSKTGYTTLIPKTDGKFLRYSVSQGEQEKELVNEPIGFVWKRRKDINNELREQPK
ncbi:hypothetical protein [Fuchsiella alkaliacetigena]|uniref:hypothetical protein n=1 Tax=Fuchsiella alkaliacetigena TaxID=957042 RepID=UPI00200A9D31|nr:hypothetical protein [Fuchsiella alkaliacetigena]MCK8825811.1 hypothetical protein [Fuchsiella alkaliacetigena]